MGAMAARDQERDAHLISNGFNVIRFWNSDVDQNLNGVLEAIERLLREPPPRPATPADPSRKSLRPGARKRGPGGEGK